MIDKAIAKITKEMMELDNDFARFIEEYLTGICTTERVAEKLLDPGKSLKEFVEKVTSEYEEKAKKQGHGCQAVGAPDGYFFKRAEEYYGIGFAKTSPPKIDVMDLL